MGTTYTSADSVLFDCSMAFETFASVTRSQFSFWNITGGGFS
ncbi:hypothetical protein PF007_g14683 [Phytophthora fragariae]|uniref:Uncharacterized protein n=1 Tax=Phytophthora fragariae TaxID=53985 RepID=A0A6A3RYW5_9STRA|nr:hypothetical protein PF007_g14683 [Phytophthora fragariae]